jgi:hypothetical protein
MNSRPGVENTSKPVAAHANALTKIVAAQISEFCQNSEILWLSNHPVRWKNSGPSALIGSDCRCRGVDAESAVNEFTG